MGDAPLEILWSPSGVYVAITWSDDTAVPVWSLDAYYFGSGTVHAIDVASCLGCGDPYPPNSSFNTPEPNIAAVAWLDDETTLLLAIERAKDGSWMNGATLSAVKLSLPDDMVNASFDKDALVCTLGEHLGPRILRDLDKPPTSTPP